MTTRGKLPNLLAVDVNLELEGKAKVDYANYMNEQQSQHLEKSFTQAICTQINQIQLQEVELFLLL